jgi:hypothetical protein
LVEEIDGGAFGEAVFAQTKPECIDVLERRNVGLLKDEMN